MKYPLQQLGSLILPITVVILVPLWIERHIFIAWGVPLIAGLVVISLGLFLMAETILAFIHIGKGTLAPWSPTRKLVIGGLYAYVRNPMILGVITVLLGESIAIASMPIFIWAVLVFLINTAYFILMEEPGLEERFGDEYREYKRNVRRWIPRLKPWKPAIRD